MGEVRTVLDNNQSSLRHLCLGAYLKRDHSWDRVFESVAVKNLTQLDLVDTRISHIVLARIAHAHNLHSLTLHGTFEEPTPASVVFGSDHVFGGEHTFLPHLESFRFIMVGHDDDLALFTSVVQFLRQRTKLRRLDLGNCPWELVQVLLPELTRLRVLRVRIANVNESAINTLVNSLPVEMVAIHLSSAISDKPIVGVLLYSIRDLTHMFCLGGLRTRFQEVHFPVITSPRELPYPTTPTYDDDRERVQAPV